MRNHVGTGSYVVGLVAALCAAPLLNAALLHVSAAPSVTWQTVHNATSEAPGATLKTIGVKCPRGTHLSGGGARVNYHGTGGTGNSPQDTHGILLASVPDQANGWVATGIDRAPGDAWGVVVYAICATP